MKNVAAGANPMDVKRGMQKAVKAAVGAFTANSKKVSGSADIARVATVSAGDETVGTLIAEAMEKVGADGVITIEESKTAETYSEVVEGMQFDRGYITPYMVTDTERMEAVLDDAYLLITDKKISVIADIPVSYTHLDVYKRQHRARDGARRGPPRPRLCRPAGSLLRQISCARHSRKRNFPVRRHQAAGPQRGPAAFLNRETTGSASGGAPQKSFRFKQRAKRAANSKLSGAKDCR